MKNKINNLQVLRAVAALLVVYVHTLFVFWGLGPFGGFGVPVFFVISGFIMANVCAMDSREFFKRRLIRILPLYWMFTLVIFILTLASPHLLGATRASLGDFAKSLFFIPFKKADGQMQPMLYVGWTLNYEMLFYTIISVCLIVSRRFAMVLTIFFVVLVQAVAHQFAGMSALAKFYANPLMYDFVAGVVGYYLYVAMTNKVCFQLRAVTAASALLSFFSLALLEGHYRLHGDDFRIGLLSFILVISMTILSKAGIDSHSRILILIGDASYALYLTHPFVETFIRRILMRQRFQLLRIDTLPGMLFALAVSTIVAIILHLYMERPLTRYLTSKLFKGHRARQFDSIAASPSPVGYAP